MGFWSDSEIGTLLRLRDEGLSYAGIAKRVGRSRNAVASAVRRHVHRIPDLRKNRKKNRPTQGREVARCWDETMLTEPYAMRKLRRQMQ